MMSQCLTEFSLVHETGHHCYKTENLLKLDTTYDATVLTKLSL